MEKHELLKYVGNLDQTGACRHYTLTEGWARNMRAVDINTGSGLQYTVLPDRGMDISLASFKGVNLVYLTCNGETHPSYYEAMGNGWLRTFAAGLLTTCGLSHLGPPEIDNGEQLGLHGRYSTIPARQLADLSHWEGDEYHYMLRGIIEEGSLFGNKLRMNREISSVNGKNLIRIKDEITNFGNKPSPYTILYHMNFGYPFLSEDTELVLYPEETIPRDNEALSGIKDFRKFIKPQPDYSEQVFFHKVKGDQNGKTIVTIKNVKSAIAVNISFNINSLPFVNQWKMMGYGEYVLGIEPSNVQCKSRSILRKENALPVLQPGNSIINEIEITINTI